MKLVYGVGINDGTYKAYINNISVQQYKFWTRMLERCYSKKIHDKYPTYVGCTPSANFIYYTYFYEWCIDQVGFSNKGWNLDKDILIKGNKLYSEDTCVFVPQDINKLFTKTNALRGNCPIGVSYNTRDEVYETSVSMGQNKNHRLGCFDNPIDAFYVYKKAKENYIKQVAEKYKSEIDIRVYAAMMNYEVEITD